MSLKKYNEKESKTQVDYLGGKRTLKKLTTDFGRIIIMSEQAIWNANLRKMRSLSRPRL